MSASTFPACKRCRLCAFAISSILVLLNLPLDVICMVKADDLSVDKEAEVDSMPRVTDGLAASDELDDPKEDREPISNADASTNVAALPNSLPDGRSIRTIGIYDSQKFELIPRDYRAVKSDAFADAVSRLQKGSRDQDSGRVSAATFWIELQDDRLVSKRSFVEVETIQPGVIQQNLGNVNFSLIREVGSAESDALPQIVSDEKGNLVAVIDADDSELEPIEFAWQLAGQPTSRGHEFQLTIPRSPESRLLFSVPKEVRLESLDGVLSSLSEAPQGAESPDNNRRWYELSAGGISSIRLRSIAAGQKRSGEAFVLRRTSVEYTIDPSGIFFLQRLELGLPVGSGLPWFSIQDAKITSVKVNAAEAEFINVDQQSIHSLTDKHSSSLYQVLTPPGAIGRQDTRASISIMGQASWDEACDLPLAEVSVSSGSDYQLIDACVDDQARIAVSDSLRLVDWSLPVNWARQPAEDIEGYDVEIAVGPSLIAELASKSKRPWSRVHLTHDFLCLVRDFWLRTEVSDNSAMSDANVEIQVDPSRLDPLQLEVQQGWNLERIELLKSGRVLETPSVRPSDSDTDRRFVTIWPEASDIETIELVPDLPTPDDSFATGSRPDKRPKDSIAILRMRVVGSRSISKDKSRLVMPSHWFVRVLSPDGKTAPSLAFTAGIVSANDMKWSGETAMLPELISVESLSPDQRKFFSVQDRDAMLFQTLSQHVEAVGLETPSIEYAANLSLQITKSSDEIREQLHVNLESVGRSVDALVIHAGPAVDRPPYRWLMPGENGSPSISLAASDVTLTEAKDRGIYTINVAGLDLANRPLIGRRRYQAKPLKLQLPSVPRAASGKSELFIGGDLEIARKDPAVQLVPRVARTSHHAAVETDLGKSGTEQSVSIDSAAIAHRQGVHLRYDAVEEPSIELALARGNSNVNVVTDSRVRVIASSRGNDRIELVYQVSLTKPLAIDYEPSLRLASISRDHSKINLDDEGWGRLVLEPLEGEGFGKPETIRIDWNRANIGFHVFRECRIPKFKVNASVLHSTHQLIASPDTFAPISLLMGKSKKQSFQVVEMVPGDVATLIRFNVSLAVGWLTSLLVFTASWIAMRRAPFFMLMVLTVLVFVALLWWPWRLAVIGWCIVPLIAAAMLVTSRRWNFASTPYDRKDSPSDDNTSDTAIIGGDNSDRSEDFSWRSVFQALAFVLLSFSSPTMSKAQINASTIPTSENSAESGESSGKKKSSVNVIIPLDEENQPSGEFIYVPKSIHELLFPSNASTKTEGARFIEANYLMRISSNESSDGTGTSAILEADYWIDLANDFSESGMARQINRVTLPIDQRLIEQIKLVGSDHRIVRSTSDGKGNTLVSLPNGKRFHLQLILNPKAFRDGAWSGFGIGIPSVASSRLQVESSVNLQVLRVGGVQGRLIEETDLRRWVTSLGPKDRLDVDFRIDPRSTLFGTTEGKPLQRRYWVSAGKTKTTIDCEVDPPESVAAGEEFQFVIRDAAMPILMSSDWRLVSDDLYTSNRRLMSVVSLRDKPGPVHLIWTFPVNKLSRNSEIGMRSSRVGDTAETNVRQIQIPEVIAASLGETAPAWIAFHCPDSLLFDPLPRSSIEPLSVDQFLAGWSGYRGRIDRAFVALNEMPTPILRRKATTNGRIDSSHQLRVSSKNIELRYVADVTSNGQYQGPYLLSIPKSLRLAELLIDGRSAEQVSIETGDRRHLLIENPKDLNEVLRISVVAIGDLNDVEFADRSQFIPPVIVLNRQSSSVHERPEDEADHILPSQLSRSSTYSVWRTRDSFIQIIEPFTIKATRTLETATAANLADGFLPVATWKVQSQDLTSVAAGSTSGSELLDIETGKWGGLFRVRHRTSGFDCDQLIALERTTGDWEVVSKIQFVNERIPDYVDVEIPNRWSDSLLVSPTTVWSRQPSASDAKQVIRIRCDGNRFLEQPLILTGRLSQSDDGRVSVPSIRVLGTGLRRIFISVPQRLVNEKVNWRTRGIESSDVPNSLLSPKTASKLSTTRDSVNDSQSSRLMDKPTQAKNQTLNYKTVRKSWSVDLAPLPELSLQPIALTQDNQVFLTADGFYVLTHWDLSPGTLESISIRLPADSTCRGAWSGGVSVTPASDPEPTESKQGLMSKKPKRNSVIAIHAKTRRDQLLKIPLSLSHLPQAVKVLVHIPSGQSRRRDYVPELVDIPITQNWLAVRQPRDLGNVPLSERMLEISRQRNVSLARSVVDSVEIAVDIVAERSSDEVVAWLRPWVDRYLDLTAASDHTAGFVADADAVPVVSHLDQKPEATFRKFEKVQWNALDDRMAIYAKRYLREFSDGDDTTSNQDWPSEPAGSGKSIFSDSQFRGFEIERIMHLGSANNAPELRSISTSDKRLKDVIGNTITLMLVGGILFCLRPLKRLAIPALLHPAFWLGALGAAGFFVAPIYVAASLILVAFCMTAFPASSRESAASTSRYS